MRKSRGNKEDLLSVAVTVTITVPVVLLSSPPEHRRIEILLESFTQAPDPTAEVMGILLLPSTVTATAAATAAALSILMTASQQVN